MPTDSQLLATVVEQGRNMEKNFDAHMRDDHERFERTFLYLKSEFNEIGGRLDKFERTLDNRVRPIENKVETLWDARNKQEGAFGVGKWVAGVLGGVVGAAITFWSNQHGGSSGGSQ